MHSKSRMAGVTLKTINVETLDGDLRPTSDSVKGSPMVTAFVTIDGEEVVAGLYALVDTGCDYSVISPSHIAHVRSKLTPVDKSTISDSHLRNDPAAVFMAKVDIDGRNDPLEEYVVEKPCGRHPMLIGRNLLRHYRFIYDPIQEEYALTKP